MVVLERGFRFVRHGGSHDVYGKGRDVVAVPRGRETDERTAMRILKFVRSR
jgi:mRNA interferase HicA